MIVPGWDRRILLSTLSIVGIAICWWLGRTVTQSLILAVYALFGLFSILALLKPEWGFYLILSIGFSFIPYDIRINLPLFDSALEVLIFACLAGAVSKLVVSRRPLPFLPIFVPLAFMVFAHTGIALIGHGMVLLPSWWMYLPQFQLSVGDLYFLAFTLLGALFTWLLVDTPDKARNVLISILVGVALRTMVSTGWLLATPGAFSDEVGIVRLTSHMGLANTPLLTRLLTGPFMALLLNTAQFFPVFLALSLTLRSRPILRLICLVTVGGFIITNALSGFRASIVTLATGTLVLLLLGPHWMPNRRTGIGMMLLSVFGMVLVANAGGGARALASLIETVTTGSGDRADLYRFQINLFLQSPIFGTGFRGDHSDLLDRASAMGLIYLAPTLIATLWPIRQLWRLLRSTQGIEERALLAGLLAGWVGIMVMATVNVVLTHPEAGMRFWSLAVIIGLWTRWHSERPGTSVVRISRTSEPPSA